MGRCLTLPLRDLWARHSACSASYAARALSNSCASMLGGASSSSDEWGGLEDLLLLAGLRLYLSSLACGCCTFCLLAGLSGWSGGCIPGPDRGGGEMLVWCVVGRRWGGGVCRGPSRPGRTQTLCTEAGGPVLHVRWSWCCPGCSLWCSSRLTGPRCGRSPGWVSGCARLAVGGWCGLGDPVRCGPGVMASGCAQPALSGPVCMGGGGCEWCCCHVPWGG